MIYIYILKKKLLSSCKIWLKVILLVFKHRSHRSDFNYETPVIFFNFIPKSNCM